jgi:release factor glutamine methyltransferase
VTPDQRRELAAEQQERLLKIGALHEATWILDSLAQLPNLDFSELRRRHADILFRREANEPLAYILGSWSFRTHEFFVGPGVLIPRPETEELVEAVLKTLHNTESSATKIFKDRFRIADLGAGSGCIGLSIVADLIESLCLEGLDKESASARIELDLVESSPAALPWLQRNVEAFRKKLGSARVRVVHKSWSQWGLEPGEWDLVVSNPPYVTQDELNNCDESVRAYEPVSALLPGNLSDFSDATGAYREIFELARIRLVSGGWLWFELGTHQGAWIKDYAMSLGFWNDVRTMRDLARKVRFFCARRSHPAADEESFGG